ncbi:MAG TPA: FtsQ-type POTRA domain-containing protein [Anaeromyxobacter sp.]|nr:FtsQ-type POTRA domain-containing protein [Anaeromyxobacter sp.]
MARGANRRRVDRVPGERGRAVAALAARAGWPLAGAAAVALAAAGAWRAGVKGELLRIREIRFEGLSRAAPAELLELSPVQRGDHLLLVDTDLVAAALRRHPWVAAVEVSRDLPDALAVKVAERRAAALVDLGGLYLVDDKGEVFKRAVPGDGLDLPVVTGIAREAWVERRAEVEPLLTAALALLGRWAERGLDRRAPVSEIHIDPDFGTTLWAGDDGLEVRLGQGDLPQKLDRLERVLSAVAADGQRAEVLHLDNRRRPDWVAVRLRAIGPRGP